MAISKFKKRELAPTPEFNPTSFFNSIIRVNETTYQDILNTLLDKDKNLELKTHIVKPKDLTNLRMYGKYFKSIKLVKCGKYIKDWINCFLAYMVSWKRESRKETVRVLSSAIETEPEVKGSRKMVTNFK